MTPPADLAGPLAASLAGAPDGSIGVAVSGGSDSMALLLLARDWAGRTGRGIFAITVDHGLRDGSAVEAAAVATFCQSQGIAHDICRWTGWDGRGNLQDQARQARQALIASRAAERGLAAVALGHTLDDQAETFLLRLARGSGVDGLAAMRSSTVIDGVCWLRPMLALRRADLRRWLAAEGVCWVDDPSNADTRFDRVRARNALGVLAELGLGPERLAATALNMGRARDALDAATADLARAALREGPAGDLALDMVAFARAPEEVRLRLLASALAWVSGAVYRPRLGSLQQALAALEGGGIGQGLTLHGCVLRPHEGRIAIRREPSRVAPPVPLARGIWDSRWLYDGRQDDPGLSIGALGEAGLARFGTWRETGIARETLLGSPALWRADEPVCAPFATPGADRVFRRHGALIPPWGDALMR